MTTATMDKFMLDLDQMLDDLEAQEETAARNQYQTSPSPGVVDQQHHVTSSTDAINSLATNGAPSFPTVNLLEVDEPEAPSSVNSSQQPVAVSLAENVSHQQLHPKQPQTFESFQVNLPSPSPSQETTAHHHAASSSIDSDLDKEPVGEVAGGGETCHPTQTSTFSCDVDSSSSSHQISEPYERKGEASLKKPESHLMDVDFGVGNVVQVDVSQSDVKDDDRIWSHKVEESSSQPSKQPLLPLSKESPTKFSESVESIEEPIVTVSCSRSSSSQQLKESADMKLLSSMIAGPVTVTLRDDDYGDDFNLLDGCSSTKGTTLSSNHELTEEQLMEKVLQDLDEYEKARKNGQIDDFIDDIDFEDDDFNEMMKEITNSEFKRIGRRTPARRHSESSDDDGEGKIATLSTYHKSSGLQGATSKTTTSSASAVFTNLHRRQDTSCDSRYHLVGDSVKNTSNGDDNGEVSSAGCVRFQDCHVEDDDLSEQNMNQYLADVESSLLDRLDEGENDPTEGTIKVEVDVTPVRPTRPSSLNIPSRETISAASASNRNSSNNQSSNLSPIEEDGSTSPPEDELQSSANGADSQQQNNSTDMSPHDQNNPDENNVRVGFYKPFWIPDNEAPVCMHCDTKFTVIKRRHHCRACGKVLCASCCNMKVKLPYMDYKEARVCSICHRLISDYDDFPPSQNENVNSNNGSSQGPTSSTGQLDPSEVGTSSEQVAGAAGGAASSFVPVGVLKKADRPKGEPKQVVFSDGIRPGRGSLTEDESGAAATGTNGPSSPPESSGSTLKKHLQRLRSPPADVSVPPPFPSKKHSYKPNRITIEDPPGQPSSLPPVINCPALAANPTMETLINLLRTNAPVTFYLTKNLHVNVKLVKLDCCVNTEVWSFASKGLACVGQDEVAVILEKLDDESTVPRDIFKLISHVWESSSRGVVHSEMSHLLFPDGIFGSREHGGFLFVRPTVQCLTNILIPPAPFLIALLVQRSEVPWIKVFPLRLLLRLGAEFSTYPFPVVSYRQRSPAFSSDVGHTILNVLADFRNFQYTIPVVPGVLIRRESQERKVVVSLPKNRFDSIVKVLNQNNEHVLALGGNFNLSAQAHLACVQTEEGQYQSRVISPLQDETVNASQEISESSKSDDEKAAIDSEVNKSADVDGEEKKTQEHTKDITEGKITGACFVVFSGALKTTTGWTGKVGIVEDGISVQIPPNIMTDLKTALREKKDFEIKCGKAGSCDDAINDVVIVEWTKSDTHFNVGVRSHIDGKPLEGIPSVRVHHTTDYANKQFIIRWTEVFFLEGYGSRGDSMDATHIAGIISQSLCRALLPHLDQLFVQGMTKIGLRVSLDPDRVGYDVGSNGQQLPDIFVSDLDASLIPIITGNLLSNLERTLVVELIFYIIFK